MSLTNIGMHSNSKGVLIMFDEAVKSFIHIFNPCFLGDERPQSTPSIHMKRLRKLVEEDTPDLAEFTVTSEKENETHYNLSQSVMKHIGLYKNENVAIGKAFGEKGEVFPVHVHNEIEWLGVIYGGIVITEYPGTKKEKIVPLVQHQAYYIKAGVPHSVTYTEDSDLWTITMPANHTYPKGGNMPEEKITDTEKFYHLVKEIERINIEVNKLRETCGTNALNIAVLNFKSTMWGAIGGAIPTAIGGLIIYLTMG
jgi:quercetin dioxygenase-like cupin family protein